MIFLDALGKKNHATRPPVWLMRQAGRYMHEYQLLRKKYDFLTLCHTPELIVEITHQPIDAFGFDAAIVFSDILLILEAFGFDLRFIDEVGPIITNQLVQGMKLERKDVTANLSYVLQAIKLLKKSLPVPLIGFAGAPFTVASYLCKDAKWWLLEDPDSFDKILDVLADATIEYLNAQIDTGVDAVQIFESWADRLAVPQFDRFVKKPIEKIVKGLKKCPVILFGRANIERLSPLSPAALSLSCHTSLQEARRQFPNIALQGNLDPDILRTNPETVMRETKALLESMKADPAFIFNLSHGVHKETPRENVQALVDTIKSTL